MGVSVEAKISSLSLVGYYKNWPADPFVCRRTRHRYVLPIRGRAVHFEQGLEISWLYPGRNIFIRKLIVSFFKILRILSDIKSRFPTLVGMRAYPSQSCVYDHNTDWVMRD